MRHDYVFEKQSFENIPAAIAFLQDRMHDEHFNLRDLRYAAETQTLEIPFRRMFYEGWWEHVVRDWVLFQVIEVDVIRCCLTIQNVVSWEVLDRTGSDDYVFLELAYDAASGRLRIICSQNCEIQTILIKPRIKYEEQEFRGKSRVICGIFGEISNGKVYE